MMNKTFSQKGRLGLAASLISAGTLAMTGCGIQLASLSAPIAAAGTALHGSVHGGQQPVSGSTIQLYTTNSTGYAAGSYALLTTPVTTDSNGFFNITGDYTCPSSSSLVYLTATGGNPGLTGSPSTNPNLAMMTALGACGNLTPTTFISINELTTVASAFALAPFMTGPAYAGTSATNVTGLTNAFAAVSRLVNTGTGVVPGTLPAGATAPTTKLNTIADILASCINSSGGTTGDGSACGTLFAKTTPATGVAPTDTITAALNIAKNPGANVSSLLTMVQATAPFQPTMPIATDFTLAIKYAPAGTFSSPSASALDASGRLWVTNSASNTVALLDATGTPVMGSPFSIGGYTGPSGVAIDTGGDAWVTYKTSSNLGVFTPAGAGSTTSTPGLSSPTSVAINGAGQLWITNSGNNSVTAVNVSGTTVNSSTVYSTGGISAPVAVAIDPK